MANVLCVGIATLDIINTVARYPHEDEEVRASAQRITRGGNATNTLVVLSQLGHHCHWAGVLVDEPDAARIRSDLQRYAIDTGACAILSNGKVPTSYITLSATTGSRTIVHYRDLPEYGFTEFKKLDLSRYDWIHFEGRNVEDTRQMMAWARAQRADLPISLEVEKSRPAIETLYPYANLIVFSRAFVTAHAASANPQEFLAAQRETLEHADLVCPWGSDGAYGLAVGEDIVHAPAVPTRVIDTLAAGDTFNAALIDARLQGFGLAATLAAACRLAGRKCGFIGLDFSGDIARD